MNTEELWTKVTREPKWYAGLISQNGTFYSPQAANRLKKRFRDGTLSQKVIDDVFTQLGYRKVPGTWVKA